MSIVNISSYLFFQLENPLALKDTLRAECKRLGLLGTILIATEGINLMLAGSRESIDAIKQFMATIPPLEKMEFKESLSDFVPYEKLFTKVRKEIVTIGVPEITLHNQPSHYLDPEELKNWYDNNSDFTLLDTRNHFEVEYGHFKNTVELNIKHFREFPEATKKMDPALKDQPLVIVCTGGIRCEKAAMVLQEQGFKKVYQLHGGILKYFEKCGGDYWEGNCFVFDDRISVNSKLETIKN
ncbi:MAG: sulfurtransferase [Proteobacteria bacterium]|nr:sulfurtransferase [Pseudomonadota bacterium]